MNTNVEQLVSIPLDGRFRGVLRSALLAAKRFLRSPRVIVAEILAIALAGIVGASLPQQGTASLVELARLRSHGPLGGFLVHLFALDHVFRSAWFVALTLLAGGSLSLVVLEQVRRLRVMWTRPLTEAKFQTAPFRLEFERPARLAAAGGGGRKVELRTRGRLGLSGTVVFHVALLLIIVAGGLRALFAVDAAVDLIEGETLLPAPSAWLAHWPGALARPFNLDVPLTLNTVHGNRYAEGDLQDLFVRVSVQQRGGTVEEQIGINRELQAPGGRLYLSADFGPAALIEWKESGGPPVGKAILLKSQGKGRFEGTGDGPGMTRLHLRAEVDSAGNRPQDIEIRVVGEGGVPLLYTGLLRVGEEVSLPGGQLLKLHGLPFWARLRGSRDPALWLAYSGFTLALIGLAIVFTIVKHDTCVVVTPDGERERVFVALQSQRFAPLFEERFRRLVRSEGGPA